MPKWQPPVTTKALSLPFASFCSSASSFSVATGTSFARHGDLINKRTKDLCIFSLQLLGGFGVNLSSQIQSRRIISELQNDDKHLFKEIMYSFFVSCTHDPLHPQTQHGPISLWPEAHPQNIWEFKNLKISSLAKPKQSPQSASAWEAGYPLKTPKIHSSGVVILAL